LVKLENFIRKAGNFVLMDISFDYCHQNMVRRQSDDVE